MQKRHAIEEGPLQECPAMWKGPLQIHCAKSWGPTAVTACHSELFGHMGHSECVWLQHCVRKTLTISACVLMCHWVMLYQHLGHLNNHSAFEGHAPMSRYQVNDATKKMRHDAPCQSRGSTPVGKLQPRVSSLPLETPLTPANELLSRSSMQWCVGCSGIKTTTL